MKKVYFDKLAFIEVQDKKLLVTLSKGKDTWYTPGGKREAGETDKQALIREIKEELAVDLIPDSIKKYGVFVAQAHGKSEGKFVRMFCYTASFNGSLLPSSEIEKIDYFGYSQKHLTSEVDNLIFEDLKSKGLVE